MDSAVLNTHTHQNKMQRPQTNENLNGPRVSFNKDVHVKRIGNDHQTYKHTNIPFFYLKNPKNKQITYTYTQTS